MNHIGYVIIRNVQLQLYQIFFKNIIPIYKKLQLYQIFFKYNPDI